MAKPLRILILEDNPIDADLVQFELQEAGFTIDSKVVKTEEDFLRELQDYCPDIILSDYDLPKYSGALALAVARERCPDIPFILVTGAVTEDRAIEILTQGAKDYVLKTRLQQRLVPAIRRALAEAEEHRARKQAEAELLEAHRTLEERVRTRTAQLEAEMGERKRVENELQRMKKQSDMILNSVGEGILGLDMHGNHTFASPCAAKMLNYKVDELIGKHSHSLWHYKKPDGSPYPEEECPICKGLKDGITRRVDTEIFWKKDGTNFPVECLSTPIQEGGKIIGTVVIFNNITKSKQA